MNKTQQVGRLPTLKLHVETVRELSDGELKSVVAGNGKARAGATFHISSYCTGSLTGSCGPGCYTKNTWVL